jgi:hypothetical protein
MTRFTLGGRTIDTDAGTDTARDRHQITNAALADYQCRECWQAISDSAVCELGADARIVHDICCDDCAEEIDAEPDGWRFADVSLWREDQTAQTVAGADTREAFRLLNDTYRAQHQPRSLSGDGMPTWYWSRMAACIRDQATEQRDSETAQARRDARLLAL